MAGKNDSPKPSNATPSKRKLPNSLNSLLVDSANTPKSLAMRFQNPEGNTTNPRKSLRSQRNNLGPDQDDSMNSTDDEYFTHPREPKEIKKTNKGKKKTTGTPDHPPRSKKGGADTSRNGMAASDSNTSLASSGKAPKSQDMDTYNMLSDLLNTQSD